MKKTMIALAAVAAVGAASAQVSITGEAAWGFLSTSDGAGASASGFGIDTALLTFQAKEDLGNGISAAAKLQATTSAGIGGTAGIDDQSLTLSFPMATVSLLTYKPGDWVSGASGAATWYGLDGKVFSARQTRDAMAVTLPLAAGLSLTAAYLEPGNSLGEGAGSSGTTSQSVYNFGVKYATGPATLQAAFLQYTNVTSLDSKTDTVTRLGANVDLGVAKIGGGLQIAKTGAGGTNTQTAMSVSAPLNAGLSAQAVYGMNNVDFAATSALAGLNGRRSGYMLGLTYNLSKRTYAQLNSGTWRGSNSTTFTIDSGDSSMYAVTLVHDF